MGFNLDRYDLTQFNLGGPPAIFLIVSGKETIRPVLGSSSDLFISAAGSEFVNRSISGLPCRYIDGSSGLETISESVLKGEMFILSAPHFAENVSASVVKSADITPSARGLESVTLQGMIAANVHCPVHFVENIQEEVWLGTDLLLIASGYELISESASVVVLDQKVCNLTVTLKPGQKLIIDAGNYTVLLDGENAIELQNGEWIDELDRETTDISILAATGTDYLTASITYQERYL